MLGVFSALVSRWIRVDRLADLDATLQARAAAMAARVEREGDGWLMEPQDPELMATLTGARVVGSDGVEISAVGDLTGRVWTGAFEVDDDEGDGPETVTISVGASTAPVEDGLARLHGALGVAGLVLGSASIAVGVLIARRLGDAEEMRRLRVRYEQQARFTADASHELRTPLAVIRTEVDLALRRERAPEEYRDAQTSVREGADRMQGILDALLLLARADAGAGADHVDLDLREVARDVAGTVPVEGQPARMRGDARLLGILVRNLVSNALRHTPSGAVRVCVDARDDEVVLDVIDEGEGIPPEALPHVRERFYRVDAARARDAGGAGLGLSIVDTVARLHGASVELASVLGRGTRVTVRFPSGRLQAGRA